MIFQKLVSTMGEVVSELKCGEGFSEEGAVDLMSEGPGEERLL